MAEFDFDFVSLIMSMVGLFFICCAIALKKPKHILEEMFGVYSGGLRDLKSSVFKKHQLFLGYGCIAFAIILNVFSRSLARADEHAILDSLNPLTLALALVGLVAVLCAILNYLSRLFSKWHFRKIVTEVIKEHRWPFESNVTLAAEVGQLLGLQRDPDDTVDVYLAKLRDHLDLPAAPERERRTTRTSRIGLEFK